MRVDVVIPLYNSQFLLDDLIDALLNWKDVSKYEPCVIFVDDCSQDKTISALQNQQKLKALPHKIIQLTRNSGQYTATWVGLQNAEAPFIITMDDDLQHSPDFFDELVDQLIFGNADLLYANYANKKHHFVRNLGTTLIQKTLYSLANIDYRNVTSFRVLRRSILDLYKHEGIHQIYFIEELLISSSKKVIFKEVSHSESIRKKSNYSLFKLSKMALSIMFFHSSLLLKLISNMGIFISLICFLIGSYFIYQKLFNYVEIGFTGIIVSILFSTGILLFSIGIIGEFLRRILIRQQKMDMVQFRQIEISDVDQKNL
jgi:glycosyltransferase involved in cell wall biosynthesis